MFIDITDEMGNIHSINVFHITRVSENKNMSNTLNLLNGSTIMLPHTTDLEALKTAIETQRFYACNDKRIPTSC